MANGYYTCLLKLLVLELSERLPTASNTLCLFFDLRLEPLFYNKKINKFMYEHGVFAIGRWIDCHI